MKKNGLLMALALASLGTVAGAQTVTVAKTGTPDFATIQAAIDSFASDVDPAPNVIQITDNALYDEAILITRGLTLEGTGPTRPILAVRTGTNPPLTDLNDGLGIFFTTSGETVTLRNLIVIPSTTTPPADDLIRSNSAASITGISVVLDNILVAPNNGSNQPVSDGNTAVDLTTVTGLVAIGDDGIFLSAATGSGLTATLTNVVVTHNQTGSNADGLVAGSATGSVIIGDGCVFSYNGRLGIQANAGQTFRIDAPNQRVKVIGSRGFAGIWFAGAQSVERSINGLIVSDIVGNGNTTGWGIENQNRGTIEATFSNIIISACTMHGILIGNVGSGNTTINNVTIARNGRNAIQNSSGSAGDVTINDSILAGNGGTSADEIVNNAGTGTITVNFSALVNAGPQALNSALTAGAVTLNNVINADPQFAEVTDFNSADFYKVNNLAYLTAGSANTALRGGSTAILSTRDWPMY